MRSFRRALGYFRRDRRAVLIGLLAIPVGQGLSMAIPWIIGNGIDELRDGALSLPLSRWFLLIVALAAVRGVAKFLMRWCIVSASRRMEESLRDDLFRHLLTLRPDDLQGERSGDLMTRLTWDVEAVRMFLGPGLMYLTETLLVLPPALVILAWFDPILAALLLVPLALIVVVMKTSAEPIHVESQKGQERLSDMSNLAQESFAGVRVLRAFAREEAATRRFEAASRDYADQTITVAKVRAISWSLMSAAKDVGVLLLLSAGCVQLVRGAITLGQFVVFNMYLGLLFWPMVALGWMIAMYQRAKVSMDRINHIFDQEPALPEQAAWKRPESIGGELRFVGLRVDRGGREVLRGVDLHIPAGAVIGVTGPVGSGKSTLAQVLPRLVDIADGACFVDGHDLTTLDPRLVRRAVGFVPQDAFLFADTLRANLAFGREDGDDPVDAARIDAALVDALRNARVADEILGLPRGLDAVVGERGVTLSGGQRQRCTIARALAAAPRILILDDCLSAVDAETEAEILAALRAAMRGRTAILISHRVAALKLADRVLVLDDGRVVEEGAPADLLRRDGPYRRLHDRQQAEEAIDAIE